MGQYLTKFNSAQTIGEQHKNVVNISDPESISISDSIETQTQAQTQAQILLTDLITLYGPPTNESSVGSSFFASCYSEDCYLVSNRQRLINSGAKRIVWKSLTNTPNIAYVVNNIVVKHIILL